MIFQADALRHVEGRPAPMVKCLTTPTSHGRLQLQIERSEATVNLRLQSTQTPNMQRNAWHVRKMMMELDQMLLSHGMKV